jgi:hypothetical protein
LVPCCFLGSTVLLREGAQVQRVILHSEADQGCTPTTILTAVGVLDKITTKGVVNGWTFYFFIQTMSFF